MTLKVLGLGDNVADHYVHTDTIYPGGCAYNFAIFAKWLGAEAGYLGIVGDDVAGAHILRTARDEGVDVSRCRVLHGEAPRPAVRIEDGGERVFVGGNSGGVWERPLLLDERDLGYVRGFHLVHTSIFSFVEQHLEALAATGVPLSMDFSDEFHEVLVEAHARKLTFAILSCGRLTDGATRDRIRQVHAYGVPYVLTTRGEQGALFSDGEEIYHQSAHPVEARDTMGAGDAFLTAFLLDYVAWQRRAAPDDPAAARRAAARQALERASRFAAEITLLDGSCGHGRAYRGTPD